jgi:nitrous oxidase accessory protein NosD
MRNAILGSALVAAVALAAPATAASFTVTAGSPIQAIPGNNDFQGDLAALGLTQYTGSGASVTLNLNRKVRFEYMGSESGFMDSFKGGSLAPFAEYNKMTWGPVLIGEDNFLAGAFTGVSFSSDFGVALSQIGDASFGIFLPGSVRSYSSNVLYFGFDDQLSGIDDNHDDFIVRVTAVPEPASWAMLIAGFGLVGITARRRTMKEVTA